MHRVEPTVEIAGETFRLERLESGHVLISHPLGSLTGLGDTLVEAEIDMRRTAWIYINEFGWLEEWPDSELGEYMAQVMVPNLDDEGNCQCSACRYTS